MAVPNGVIQICAGVPLSNDYKHALWFNNDYLMFQYFESKIVKTYSQYNIIRDTQSIRVEATLDEARTWNYMYFQHNGTGGGKIYFAFITRVVYVNEATVELFYEIDVMTTYMWQYTLKECFVERQHSETDGYYDNLLEEGLEVGEYVDYVTSYPEIGEMCVMLLSSIDIDRSVVDPKNPIMATGAMRNNTYTSMFIYAFDEQRISLLNRALVVLNETGLTDAVSSIWMYPKALVKKADWSKPFEVVESITPMEYEVIPSVRIDGYDPINMKLFTYPYNYIYVSNNAGGSAVYKHELVHSNPGEGELKPLNFTITGALSPEASVYMYPYNYRKKGGNFEEGISLGTYPTCAWNVDTYKLWLAQNQNQLNFNMKSAKVNASMSAITGVASGIESMVKGSYVSGASSVAGGIVPALTGTTQVDGLLAQQADMDLQPPNSHGAYTANINLWEGYQTFTVSRRTITAERAKIIDDYFTRFGYACKRVKVPNRHARKTFTYVKTVDCQITGNLSHEIIQKIESVYDGGVTFWADPNAVGVYKSPSESWNDRYNYNSCI